MDLSIIHIFSLYFIFYLYHLYLLKKYYHQATLNLSAMCANVSVGFKMSEIMVKLTDPTIVENFRFTKAEDVRVELEITGESVYNLLYKRINAKKYAEPSDSTTLLEALATAILRCFDKDAIEELYVVSLLIFDSPDVDQWRGLVDCWQLGLQRNLPKTVVDLEKFNQNQLLFDDNNCPIAINTYNFITDVQWNNMGNNFTNAGNKNQGIIRLMITII